METQMIIKGKNGSLCLNLSSLDENEINTLKNLKELKEDIIVDKFSNINIKEIIQAFNIMFNKEIEIDSCLLFGDDEETIIVSKVITNILEILMYFGYNKILCIVKDVLDNIFYYVGVQTDPENMAVIKEEDFYRYKNNINSFIEILFFIKDNFKFDELFQTIQRINNTLEKGTEDLISFKIRNNNLEENLKLLNQL
jgi:hypothetical protein